MGPRLATMRAALAELSAVTAVVRTSSVYETAPVGPPQPAFLNAAALVVSDRAPEALLDELLRIELRLGRARVERWAPRTIDLDILWIEATAVESERLVVPHPRLRERAFALVPLLELLPDARDPCTHQPYVVPPGDVRSTGERL